MADDVETNPGPIGDEGKYVAMVMNGGGEYYLPLNLLLFAGDELLNQIHDSELSKGLSVD